MTTDTAVPVEPAVATSHQVRDVVTLLRRNLKNQLRDKVGFLTPLLIPVIFMLLFVYVFGGALGKGTAGYGGDHYVDFVLPGLLIMSATAGLVAIATGTAVDMNEGIITRLRTMPVFGHAILIARLISYVLQTMISLAIVLGVALLMGLSPTGDPVRWLLLIGFLLYVSIALTWLGLAFGLAARSVAAASNGPFPLIILPLVGNGIVPPETMPTAVRYFAEYQPFSPMIATVRGLLLETPIGNNAVIGLVWATAFGVLGFFWSMRSFTRERPS